MNLGLLKMYRKDRLNNLVFLSPWICTKWSILSGRGNSAYAVYECCQAKIWHQRSKTVRQCERIFFPDFSFSQKTKRFFFHIRICTRKYTVVPYSRKFRETNAELNAKLEVRNHCTKIIVFFDNSESNEL